jgi:hypothetical protein
MFHNFNAAPSAAFHDSGSAGVSGREFVDIKAFWSLIRILRNESKVFYYLLA